MSSPPPGTPMLLDEDPDVEAQLLAYGLVPPGRTRPRPSAVSFAEDDETSASTSTGRPPLARSQTWSVASAPPPASWEIGGRWSPPRPTSAAVCLANHAIGGAA